MKQTSTWLAIPMIAAVLTVADAGTEALSLEDPGGVDSLHQMGTQLAKRDSLDAAEERFQAAIRLGNVHVTSYVG